jgi:hypothetical protein
MSRSEDHQTTYHLSFGRIWQSQEPALWVEVQTSSKESPSAPTKRRKGFLKFSFQSPTQKNLPLAGASSCISWQDEKPDQWPANQNFAQLARKHLGHCQLVGMTLIEKPDISPSILVLILSNAEHGDTPTLLIHAISPKTQLIEIITHQGKSVGRLTPTASYSVQKDTSFALGEHKLDIATIMTDGANQVLKNLWIRSLWPQEDNQDSKKPSHELLPVQEGSTLLPVFDPSASHVQTLDLQTLRRIKETLRRRRKTLLKTLDEDLEKTADSDDLITITHQIHYLEHLLVEGIPTPEEAATKPDPSWDLDITVSTGDLFNRLFEKKKKWERGLVLQTARAKKIQTHIDLCTSLLTACEQNTYTLSDLADGFAELGFKPSKLNLVPIQKTTIEPSSNRGTVQNKRPQHYQVGRCFQLETNAYVIVGRNSQESDELVKLSRSDDYWFHVEEPHQGSHVIVVARSLPKRTLDDVTKRQASILALHFSKLRETKSGFVSHTTRGKLKKTKGLAPGKWIIHQSSSLRVTYTSEDVAQIFAREL